MDCPRPNPVEKRKRNKKRRRNSSGNYTSECWSEQKPWDGWTRGRQLAALLREQNHEHLALGLPEMFLFEVALTFSSEVVKFGLDNRKNMTIVTFDYSHEHDLSPHPQEDRNP